MEKNIEISSLDVRFEKFRLKNKNAENKLLLSILENGIQVPLQGIDMNGSHVLLDGFKRYRCAKKVNIEDVPYQSIDDKEVTGIMKLIRAANIEKLDILEEARFIDELINIHNRTNADIASFVGKSTAWVSVRTGLFKDMSENLKNQIFSGKFPAYSFMYTLRPFMRINNIKMNKIEEFVNLTSGKDLSIRDIERLAHAYFKGSKNIKEQIKKGNINWGLKELKSKERKTGANCSGVEQEMLKFLEIYQNYMQKIMLKSKDERLASKAFLAQANVITGNIINQMGIFSQTIKEFYDKTRRT